MAKAREGVEIRILYDDAGCIGFLNPRFIKYMESMGIQCRVFNPIMPVLNIFMNNRDHRKITVIDGKVAYTGGYNLANEYSTSHIRMESGKIPGSVWKEMRSSL